MTRFGSSYELRIVEAIEILETAKPFGGPKRVYLETFVAREVWSRLLSKHGQRTARVGLWGCMVSLEKYEDVELWDEVARSYLC